MKIIKSSANNKYLSTLIEQINQDNLPRLINTDKGEAVLLSKKDWENLQETLYLQSIPNFVNTIQEVIETDEWVSEDEFMRELDGMDN